jgi:predicted O-methyltransferase YrrM
MLWQLKRRVKKIIRPLVQPSAMRAVRTEAGKIASIEAAVEYAYQFAHFGIRFEPNQIRPEILSFLKLIEKHPPATVLEIGTERGGTFFLFTQVATPDALLISLDLPPSPGCQYPAWREKLYRHFARGRQRIETLRGDSHSQQGLDLVRRQLAGRPLDLLFIDGDHSYDGVKKDFEMFSPLVPPTGIIGFHDIVDGPEIYVGGVPRFWRELKQTRPHLEFVKSWQQGGWGIGVLPPAAK